ncbi:MAG: cation:proton antiporter [Clostridia bacterium]|nr:cation:proton antiporter [Clostridia bacterium]MBN2883534.1 cation:proton antiporter [Clostridia bacterium]
MLLSLALIILVGFALKGIFEKLHLPGLLGMLISGILLGPHVLNLISPEIIAVSGDLREISMIVILVRVGITLDLKDLKRVGRPAILMSFIPATFEIVAVVILAPPLLGVSYLEAAILGAILGAVSPAIIVPKMLHLMEAGYGRKNSVPQMILAGASADDIYVIVLFTSFMGLATGKDFSPLQLLSIPLSIITGLAVGIAIGFILVQVFKRMHMRDTVKVLLILGLAILVMGLEPLIRDFIPFSGFLAVMAIGGTILKTYGVLAKRVTGKFAKVWVIAELILFVMLGSVVDIGHVKGVGIAAILLIIIALVFRSIGVLVCLIKTPLSRRERIFCIIAGIPKATVQAAIGAIPLAAGLAAGNTILAASVLAILISAPLGAVGIELGYKKLLESQQ